MKKLFLLLLVLCFALVGCKAINKTQNEIDFAKVQSEGKNPIVTIEMESGETIKVELMPIYAPNTVANFVTLIKSGFYDGLIFHRVIKDFMIQGGDPEGTGMGGPGYSIKGEMYDNGNKANTLKHERGVISMARSQSMDSAGSQFFIMHADYPSLDNQYCAFGKVVDDASMAVVDKIATTSTNDDDRPLTEQKMKKVTVDTFGIEYSVVKN